MALQTFDCQGTGSITPGTTQVTQTNSGLPSVNPNGSAAAIYANLPATDPVYGRTRGVKVSAGAGVTFDMRFNAAGSATKGAQQALLWLTGAPTTADCDIMTTRGTIQNAGLRLKTTGQARPLASGSEITSTSYHDNLDTGQFILIDLYTEEDSTGAAGVVKWRWWDISGAGALTTPDFSSPTTAAHAAGDSDTQVIQTARIGKTTSGAVMPDFYIVDWRFDDAATDYLTTPSLLAGELDNDNAVVVSHRVVLDFTTSFIGGAPPIEAVLVQTAGPTVTPTMVDSDPLVWEFADPAGRTADIVFEYHGEDAGSGSTDVRTVTVAPGTGPAVTTFIRELFWDGALSEFV